MQGNRRNLASTRGTPVADTLLHHYMQYVLRSESGSVREKILRGLVERALKTSDARHEMTAEDVQARIARLTQLPSYPRPVVVGTLGDLATRGIVDASRTSRKGDQLYRLTEKRFADMERATDQIERAEAAVRTVVATAVEAAHGELTSDERALVEASFVDFLSRVLSVFGAHCAASLAIEGHWEGSDGYPRLREELDRSVKGLPRQLQVTARRAFLEVMRSPTDEAKAYFFSAGQAFYMVGLLHLDPELQTLQRGRFEETTIYLDTNLLLSILLSEDHYHEAGVALAALCADLGFHLSFSKRTADEVEGLLDSADRDYRRYPPFDPATAAKIAPLIENPFLRAWLMSWPEHHTSWTQYRVRVGAWQRLLEQHRIRLDTDVDAVIVSPRARRGLQTHLAGESARQNARERGPDNGAGQRTRLPRAAEHDAQMLLALEKLVAEDDDEPHPFGSRYWFVTLDRRLANSARTQLRGRGRRICMLAEEWVQYIAPFVGPDVSQHRRAEVFAKLLGSRFFLSVGRSLSLKELQPFTTPNVGTLIADLPQAEVCEAIAEAHASVVVDGGSAAAEQRLAKFVSLVERRVRGRRKSGDLVPREELDQLVALERADNARLQEEVLDREKQIDRLKESLAVATTYQTSSLRFVRERSSAYRRRVGASLTRWMRAHRIRAFVLLAGLASLPLLMAMGAGAAVVLIVPVLLGVVATVSPRAMVTNLGAWLGLRKGGDDA